ncbi:uncharacterized protein TNCV_2214901 [Trichonephila clavipes]|nr:uncharacterized protein TNCV_2214901 [Trichonephila clavipes]
MNRVVLTEYNEDQMSRSIVGRKGQISIHSSTSEISRKIKRSENETIGYKRSLESGSSEPERKIRKGSISKMNKRALRSNVSNVLPIYSKKRRTQDNVAASKNRYNLRPRGGREVESRPAMEIKTQQGEPVRSRRGRGRNDNLFIEERTRSSNRNARRRRHQQWENQERKGASTRRSLSLDVPVGNANYI